MPLNDDSNNRENVHVFTIDVYNSVNIIMSGNWIVSDWEGVDGDER